MKTARSVAEKWVRGMQNAGQSMKDGVAAVTEAPGAKAAAAADLYLQRVRESVENRKFQDNVGAVSLEEWRKAYLEKGVGRVGEGASKAITKQERFFNWLLPRTEQAKALVAQMPKGTLEASKARMVANMEFMAREKYRRGRG